MKLRMRIESREYAVEDDAGKWIGFVSDMCVRVLEADFRDLERERFRREGNLIGSCFPQKMDGYEERLERFILEKTGFLDTAPRLPRFQLLELP